MTKLSLLRLHPILPKEIGPSWALTWQNYSYQNKIHQRFINNSGVGIVESKTKFFCRTKELGEMEAQDTGLTPEPSLENCSGSPNSKKISQTEIIYWS